MTSAEKVTVKDSRGEFYVLCDEGATAKWRKDKSIALVDVLQTFHVYATHGVKGQVSQPTKAELEYVLTHPHTRLCARNSLVY